jgi:hypothetical protein
MFPGFFDLDAGIGILSDRSAHCSFNVVVREAVLFTVHCKTNTIGHQLRIVLCRSGAICPRTLARRRMHQDMRFPARYFSTLLFFAVRARKQIVFAGNLVLGSDGIGYKASGGQHF